VVIIGPIYGIVLLWVIRNLNYFRCIRQLLLFQRNIAFFVIIVGIFAGFLTPFLSSDFAFATSDEEGGDTGSEGDNGGDNGEGSGGGDEPEPEPEPGPEPSPDPGLVPGPEPPRDPCLENPEAEGCTPEPPTNPCIEDPTAEGCQPNPGFVGPSPQPMPPYEGCLLDPTLPECVPLTSPLTPPPPVKGCHPSYPNTCIPGPPPNLSCGDIFARNFKVVGSDPHGFDGDNDGIGCEDGNGGGGNGRGCDPSYPGRCIQPPPPNLDCRDISAHNFKVVGSDPHGFDGDNDGIGCEGGVSGGGGGGNGNRGGSSTTSECQGQADCFRGTITEIVDGDTLDINNVRVRLALVNTPEQGENGYTEAIDFVRSVCGVGTTALVDEDDGQKEGSFDRVIGLVYCGNDNINNKKSLNELLLELSNAVIYQDFCGISEFSSASWAQRYGCR
jgi:hypothetical protein